MTTICQSVPQLGGVGLCLAAHMALKLSMGDLLGSWCFFIRRLSPEARYKLLHQPLFQLNKKFQVQRRPFLAVLKV